MFTDIHTHAFHPKIARHAVEHLNEAYQLDCVGEGTIADLLLREKRSGIGRCVVLCAATTPGQVVPANDYAVTLQREHPEVTAFGTLHPGYEAWESQLERLKAAGIRGLKLHPDFQHFWLDDPRLLPMLEAAQDDFFFLFHIGVVIVPLFLAGHMVIMQERFGFSLPSLPMWFSDAFTVLAIVGAFMMILRRVALPEVRFLTTLGDWGILLLVLFVLVAGFLARMQAPGYESWLLWHIFAAELVLILAPFTKLSHIVLYFMSRGQLGMDYAIKRGGASRGPAFPW